MWSSGCWASFPRRLRFNLSLFGFFIFFVAKRFSVVI